MFENDYVMRMITQMAKGIAKLLFGVDDKTEINLQSLEIDDTDSKDKYNKWIGLASSGEINQAENMLYEEIDKDNKEDLKAAIMFYDYLNHFDTDTLEEHDFSREEIKDGMKNVLSDYGYEGLTEIY